MNDNPSDNQTVFILETLTTIVNEFRKEFSEFRTTTESRLQAIENSVEQINQELFSLDVRQDRLEAIAHDLRTDVKVLRKEVLAWRRDVMAL
jgi:chromosome segregation ATPase